MTRDDAAAFIGERFSAYLDAVSRTAADSAGNLKPAIDDALRALGFVAADLPTAETSGEEADEDLRVQVAYRAMQQISRDLGATSFDIATSGDSFKLSQLRAAAEKDLAETQAAVLERFGTTGVVFADGSTSPWVTLDLNFFDDDLALELVS